MKSFVKNYQQTPRKVKLVTDAVSGDRVSVAIDKLRYLNKKASLVVKKAIESAISNAKQKGEKIDDKKVIIKVGGGRVLKRFRPRARGSSSMIKKRSSHIEVNLIE